MKRRRSRRSNRCSDISSPATQSRRARKTAASPSSPLPAKPWSAWRSRAASALPWTAACPTTRSPSLCARRNAISRSWWKACAAPEFPVHCTRGSRRPDVAGRSFLALLHCAEERLSASRFAEYLSLGQMPEDEEPRTPAAWERLLVDAAVIGGPDRWETRLNGLREELHRRYREEEDEGERARLERPHRIPGESARLCPARDRPPGRPSRSRHMGRVD